MPITINLNDCPLTKNKIEVGIPDDKETIFLKITSESKNEEYACVITKEEINIIAAILNLQEK